MQVHENDSICTACWNLAHTALEQNRSNVSSVGHRRVCVLCGRSLLRRIRFHVLTNSSEQENRIYDVIREWILPRTVSITNTYEYYIIVLHRCNYYTLSPLVDINFFWTSDRQNTISYIHFRRTDVRWMYTHLL